MTREGGANFSRREFVSRLGAGGVAAVVGFDAVARRWVAEADAATAPPFTNTPDLDGTLVFDAASLAANAHDQGNIVFNTPAAVLRPGSVKDVQKMMAYCGDRGIQVAPFGAHHAMYGHALVKGGLVIDMKSLNTVHSVGPEGADVDAGAFWHDVIQGAFEKGLTPASITGYLKATVGGTLSMGGLGVMSTYRAGAQVDQVQELQVVTGNGDLVQCSSTRNSDLFNAVLAGMGQCGVIVRAKVRLISAKQRARTWRIVYPDIGTYFKDTRILANRGEFDSVGSIPAPDTAQPFTLWATKFYDPGEAPNGFHLLRGLSPLALTATFTDHSYLDYVSLVTVLYDTFAKTVDWDNKVKPWLDLILPDAAVEDYVKAVVPELTLEDVGPTGFVLVFPMLRASYTRPLLRLPSAASGPWVWLFSILTDSTLSGPNPGYADRMLARNYDLYQRAAAVGGVRYPHGACPFTKADWQKHYGEAWPQLVASKERYDPRGILTPGPAIL
jgi:FAD/FMN-containing dehydrogenase